MTIGAIYLFGAMDFSPFETNFDFILWENGKLFRWIGLSLFLIIIEEIRIKAKKIERGLMSFPLYWEVHLGMAVSFTTSSTESRNCLIWEK